MQRIEVAPRPNYEQHLYEDLNFVYYNVPQDENWNSARYWNDEAVYVFSEAEIERLYQAGASCWDMYNDLTGELIESGKLAKLGLPAHFIPAVEKSWYRDDPSLIGRMDFSYNPENGQIRLLEFNADTPFSLYEAAVVQYDAMRERFPDSSDPELPEEERPVDQFNTIYEGLLGTWKYIHDTIGVKDCHFTSCTEPEDITNCVFSMKLAEAAGIRTHFLGIDEIGYNDVTGKFVDMDEQSIKALYKLYPYEYLLQDDKDMNAEGDDELRDLTIKLCETTLLYEAPYKMAMATKAALPLLAEKFVVSPYILKCHRTKQAADADVTLQGSYVRKPILEREGQNVQIFENRRLVCGTDDGTNKEEDYIYQEVAKLPCFTDSKGAENYPVIGIWINGGEICGMGIRESNHLVTGTKSRFVPHVFTKDGTLDPKIG